MVTVMHVSAMPHRGHGFVQGVGYPQQQIDRNEFGQQSHREFGGRGGGEDKDSGFGGGNYGSGHSRGLGRVSSRY